MTHPDDIKEINDGLFDSDDDHPVQTDWDDMEPPERDDDEPVDHLPLPYCSVCGATAHIDDSHCGLCDGPVIG